MSIVFLFLFLLYNTYSIELELNSTRLTIRPTENAYAFGILNNEKIDYFNCTIGDIKFYNHNESINWVWKYKTNYNTKNFTNVINIFKNNLLYSTKLNINILNYNPRLTIDKNIIKLSNTYDEFVTNKGHFVGNNLTTNIGNIKTYNNTWYWTGKIKDIFKNSKKEYIIIEIWIDSSILNNFFIYRDYLIYNNVYYSIYVPKYITQKNFIDIIIINMGTSNVFGIDESKINSKQVYIEDSKNKEYYNVFKISVNFISENMAKNINNKIFNYIDSGEYLNKIINFKQNKSIFIFENPIIETVYIDDYNEQYILIIFICIFTFLLNIMFMFTKNYIELEKDILKLEDKDEIKCKIQIEKNNELEVEYDYTYSWIPYDENLIFDINSALKFQKTEIYTLKGNKLENNLIKPKNNKHSIVWEAVLNDKNIQIYIEAIIPYNDFFDYLVNGFHLQMIIGKHTNIINIIHSFVGSSIILYPFVNKSIRPCTTYFVFEKYKKLNEYQNLSEKQLCNFLLQLFNALEHISVYKVSHCSVNENNIFIKDDCLMISDFSNAVPCSCIKNDELLFQICNRLKSNDIGLYSPEVIKFLNMDLNKIYIEEFDLWKIFYKNDVYIVGKMLYRLLNNEIVYTNNFLNLLERITDENINKRMDIKTATFEFKKLSFILY